LPNDDHHQPAKIGAIAMHAPRSRTVSQRRFVWLLWLALLLPMAQVAAAWHAVSHANPDASDEASGKQALHPSHCDLCLTAAAVIGGALPGEPQSLTQPAARHEAPQATIGGLWLALFTPVYRSRAPPIAPH
jgi:hypothetical protein